MLKFVQATDWESAAPVDVVISVGCTCKQCYVEFQRLISMTFDVVSVPRCLEDIPALLASGVLH